MKFVKTRGKWWAKERYTSGCGDSKSNDHVVKGYRGKGNMRKEECFLASYWLTPNPCECDSSRAHSRMSRL